MEVRALKERLEAEKAQLAAELEETRSRLHALQEGDADATSASALIHQLQASLPLALSQTLFLKWPGRVRV